MKELVRIIAIRKDGGNHQNPHEAITNFKYVKSDNSTWSCERWQMVSFLEAGNEAYVSSGYNRVYCYVRDNGRIKFVQTHSDGQPSNNLLNLPEF
jgi:hypothetical protein